MRWQGNGIIQPYETQAMGLRVEQSVPSDPITLWQFIPEDTDIDWLNGTRPLPPFHDSTFSTLGYGIEVLVSFLESSLHYDIFSLQGSQGNSPAHSLNYPANIPEVMANIAESITLHLRQETPNSTTALGAVWQQVTVVEIRWPWLILPVSIVLITAVLLIAAVLSSKSDISAVTSWKSSSLPFLFHGIRDWSHDDREALYAGEFESIKKMNAMAAKMDVCLHKAIGSGTALTRHDLRVDESSQADRPTSRQEE